MYLSEDGEMMTKFTQGRWDNCTYGAEVLSTSNQVYKWDFYMKWISSSGGGCRIGLSSDTKQQKFFYSENVTEINYIYYTGLFWSYKFVNDTSKDNKERYGRQFRNRDKVSIFLDLKRREIGFFYQ